MPLVRAGPHCRTLQLEVEKQALQTELRKMRERLKTEAEPHTPEKKTLVVPRVTKTGSLEIRKLEQWLSCALRSTRGLSIVFSSCTLMQDAPRGSAIAVCAATVGKRQRERSHDAAALAAADADAGESADLVFARVD